LQSLRAKIAALANNEFGIAYQRNLHNAEGAKNKGIGGNERPLFAGAVSRTGGVRLGQFSVCRRGTAALGAPAGE
jgi:hypothetical protein